MKRIGRLWETVVSFDNLYQAWLGHVRHADSAGLRRAVLGMVSFSRGAAPTSGPARGSRRRLEQQTGESPVGQPQQEHHR